MQSLLLALCMGLALPISPAPAVADDQAGPPPMVRAALRPAPALAIRDMADPPAPVAPTIPPPAVTPAPLDEARVVQLVEQALDRRMGGATPSPSAQTPMGTPQSQAQAHARVLMPVGPIRRAVGNVGEHLARWKQPRTRLLPLAPATAEVARPSPQSR